MKPRRGSQRGRGEKREGGGGRQREGEHRDSISCLRAVHSRTLGRISQQAPLAPVCNSCHMSVHEQDGVGVREAGSVPALIHLCCPCPRRRSRKAPASPSFSLSLPPPAFPTTRPLTFAFPLLSLPPTTTSSPPNACARGLLAPFRREYKRHSRASASRPKLLYQPRSTGHLGVGLLKSVEYEGERYVVQKLERVCGRVCA